MVGKLKAALRRTVQAVTSFQLQFVLFLSLVLAALPARAALQFDVFLGYDGIVREVRAHPQALAQCRRWLAAHLPGVRVAEEVSNASAAQRARAGSTGFLGTNGEASSASTTTGSGTHRTRAAR